MQQPLIGVTLAFLAGILCAAFVPALAAAVLAGMLVSGGLFALTRRPLWGYAALFSAFFLLGQTRFLHTQSLAPNDVSRLAPAAVTLTGRIVSDVERRDATAQRPGFALFTLQVEQAEGAWAGRIAVSGQVRARIGLASRLATPDTERPFALPHYGEQITVRGRLELPEGARNPGGYDSRAYLARKGIYALFSAPQRESLLKQGDFKGNPLLRAGLRLRHRVLEHARKALPAVQASAMNGIVLGASSELPPDLEDDFVRTGTAHILSTSGLHVGMLAAMLIFLLRLCPIPRRLAYLLAIGGLIVFAVMAGCRPAIVRSVIMASIFLLGYVFEREPDLRNTLACAALALLVYDPQNLFDAGFQMSFVTVLTIVLALPRLQGLLGRQREIPPDMRPERKAARYAGNSLVGAFWISLAAQLGAAPLTAYYFNQGAPIALLANLLIMPLIPFVIGLGLLAPLAGAIAPWLAWPLDECLYLTLLGVNGLVQGCATLPGAGIALASPSLLALSVYYLALFGGLLYAPQHGNNASQK